MRDLYISLSGAMAQEQRLSVLANNLANANTVGFKQDREVFESLMPKVNPSEVEQFSQTDAGLPPVDGKVCGDRIFAILAGTFVDHSQGTLRPTNNPFDLAIEGPGFFAVQADWGEGYTRAGNFRRNGNGELTTMDGERVLGANGPILVNSGNFVVADDGSVLIDGQQADKIRLVRFDDLRALEKTGANLFRIADPNAKAIEAVPADSIRIRQNAIELSNVNMVKEMTRMVTTERAYGMSAKALETIDRSYQQYIQMHLNR